MNDTTGLRDEIIASEQARADFQKWKLVIVAALGGVALGVGTQFTKSHVFLLCFIPPVCWYVDLLCTHLTLRMLVIGTYLRRVAEFNSHTDPSTKISQHISYEEFAEKSRSEVSPFSLENLVMYGSSLLLYLAVAIGGWILDPDLKWAYVISGVAGGVITAVANIMAQMKVSMMKAIVVERRSQRA